MRLRFLEIPHKKIGCPEGFFLRGWVSKRHPDALLAKTMHWEMTIALISELPRDPHVASHYVNSYVKGGYVDYQTLLLGRVNDLKQICTRHQICFGRSFIPNEKLKGDK